MLSHAIVDAARQVWPPFVLVAGLLMVGEAANAERLFEAAGARVAQAPLHPRAMLGSLLVLVAVVSALLNLDTAAVFMTPVLVHAARRRRLDERPFLYGPAFLANCGSLLLPGSNLTNLLVLHGEAASGLAFAGRMWPAWAAACAVAVALLVAAFPLQTGVRREAPLPHLSLGPGFVSVLVTAGLILALRNPALPVLGVGLAATVSRRVRPRVKVRVLAGLFLLALTLGTLARLWHGPASLLSHLGGWPSGGLAAVSSIVVNNLPASVLFSAQPPPHLAALLLGLDLGPNLAVTGSLAAYLWLRAARAAGACPSIWRYSLYGLVLAPATLVASLVALGIEPR